MEVTGVVFRALSNISGAGFDTHSVNRSLSGVSNHAGSRFPGEVQLLGCRDSKVCVRSKRSSGLTSSSGFSDAGHLRCYVSPRSGGKIKEKEKNQEMRMVKKKLKLIKGLSKDLSMFSSMGFGVEAEDGLIGEIKGKKITEAAEILMAQLKQLKAEEKELKGKRKEEKAKLKASQMKAMTGCEESSSSSSSECGKVVDMRRLRSESLLTQSKPDEGREPTESSPTSLMVEKSMEEVLDDCIQNSREESCSVRSVDSKNGEKGLLVAERIEVCMGGKCKKSGAGALLEELERRVGVQGAVVGCKCMGKCRDGPNVRVLNESVRSPTTTNPLCIGVGLEDVSVLVANLFGEDRNNMGLMRAL